MLLTCIGVNAAPYIVFSESVIPLNQGVSANYADKDEDSLQCLYTDESTDKTYLFGRAVQAALMGKNVFGNSCETDYVTVPGKAWKTLGNSNITIDGYGYYASNGKGFLLLRTEKSYSSSTYYWGQWVTTETYYNKVK